MTVRYEQSEHIVTITIDRPEALNALDLDTWHAFSVATERFERDDDAWVGIVTGAGERAFCAGADIKSTIARLIQDPHNNPYDSPLTIMRGQTTAKPLIAAVNGLALGGGLEIVLACDLRIAAEHAQFGAPEVTLGLIPGWGGTQRLVRELPWAIAARIVLAGERITAGEALGYGLVNAVVPPADLPSAARAAADRIVACGPLAVRAAKRAMMEGRDASIEDGLALEQSLFDAMAYTSDVREGLAAFQEKRKPAFRAS